MKIRVGTLSITLITLYSGLLFAGADYLKKAAGHYQGTLSTHLEGRFTQQPIQADLSPDKEAMKTLVVKSETGDPVLTFNLNKLGGKDFVIAGPYIDGEPKLKKDKDQDCFTDSSGDRIDICFDRDLVTIDISDKDLNPQIYISLNKFAVEKPAPLETPQIFELQSAIKRAWSFNFDNKIEMEHVIQAKSNAKAAKFNLLPHISYGTIMNMLTPSFTGVLTSAGDLLPFLFPTRWLQAKRMGILSEAEQDAMTLLRLDTASQVEALFYNYENDRAIRALYYDTLEKAKGVKADVAARESLGFRTNPPGSTDNVSSIVNFLEQSYTVMDALIQEDKSAIAQVLGFYNPRAVLDAKMNSENLPVSRAQPLNIDQVTAVVLQRSVEIRQLTEFIQAADKNVGLVKWNWLDPSGDPTMNLGFNLKFNKRAAVSMVDEAKARREAFRAILPMKAFNAVTDYNQALKSYLVAAEGLQIQKRRLDQIDALLSTTGKIDLNNLISVFQDYLNAGISAQSNVLAFRVARARIDRLTLQGFYVDGTKPPQMKKQ